MPDLLGEIETRIRCLADQMMGAAFEMLGIVTALPPSTREASAEDLDEDQPSDLRSDLLCLLRDHIRPAAIGLRQAAGQRAVAAATTTFDAFEKVWSGEPPAAPRGMGAPPAPEREEARTDLAADPGEP
jgi:hypothetical protein